MVAKLTSYREAGNRVLSIGIVAAFMLAGLSVLAMNSSGATSWQGYLPDVNGNEVYDPPLYLESKAVDSTGSSEMVFNSEMWQSTYVPDAVYGNHYLVRLNPLIAIDTLGGRGYLTQHYNSWDTTSVPTHDVTPDLTSNKGAVVQFGAPPYGDPFTFRYHGFTYDRFYLSENGFICLGQNSNLSSPTPQSAFPDSSTSYPNGVIAPFWTDLTTSVGEVWCGYSSTSWPVTYSIAWWYVSSSGGDQVFVLSLRADDAFIFNYAQVNGPLGNTIAGYENINGQKGGRISSSNIHTNSRTIVYPTPASYKLVDSVTMTVDKRSGGAREVNTAAIAFANPTGNKWPFPGINVYTLDPITTSSNQNGILLDLLGFALTGLSWIPVYGEGFAILGYIMDLARFAGYFMPEWTPQDSTKSDSIKGSDTAALANLLAVEWQAKPQGYQRPLPNYFYCMPVLEWRIWDPNRLYDHSLTLSVTVKVTDNGAYNPLNPSAGFVPTSYTYSAGTLEYKFLPGDKPELAITSPNGGQSWQAGTTQSITWTMNAASGSYVNIDLYRGASLQYTIASSTPNDGSFSWAIPSTQTAASDYKIKISSTSTSAVDYSDAYFSIAAAPLPWITVTSPNGGETWKAGSYYSFTWTYGSNPGTYVNIDLYKGGVFYMGLAQAVCDGEFSMTLPNSLAGGSDYKVRIGSTSTSAYDFSNGYFTIAADDFPPTTEIVLSEPNSLGWARGNVLVALYASDDSGIVAKTMYKINSGRWIQYTDRFWLTREGVYTIYYYSVDGAGNVETTKSQSVGLDFKAPITACTLVGQKSGKIYVSPVTVYLDATDSLSGVNSLIYRIDGGPEVVNWGLSSCHFTISTSGTHKVEFYSFDNAYNTESYKSVTFTLKLP